MIRMNFFTLISVILAGSLFSLEQPDVRAIVNRLDRLYRQQSSYCLMEMNIVTPHWQRTLKMKAWSLGLDKFLVRILEPKKERGIASLKIGSEIWNYLPKISKVIKIPPSMMMGAWMGSDFTNDDLVKEYTFTEDYLFRLLPGEGDASQYVIECTPKPSVPVLWGKIVIAVARSDDMPIYQRYYDEKGKMVREMLFKEVRNFGAHRMPSLLELIPAGKPGQKTVIRYLEADFTTPVAPSLFSLNRLQSGENAP